VEIVLDLVFLMETWPRLGGFRPLIGEVIPAATLKRSQVIDFVVTRSGGEVLRNALSTSGCGSCRSGPRPGTGV